MSRFLSILSITILLVLITCSACAYTVDGYTQEQLIKNCISYTRVVQVLGKSYLIFAQNSPEWEKLAADESKTTRRFGPSGCVCTSFANAVVNSVPYEELSAIRGLMQESCKIDTRSLARGRGYRNSEKFEIQNNCDYLRYFPLVVANYAAGNNKISAHTPMSPGFYKHVLKNYGVEYSVNKNLDESLEMVKQGALAVVCSAGKGSPFSSIGHYFVIAGVDDEYVYILDSYIRSQFKRDKKGYIETVEQGVERIKLENIHKVRIGTQYIIWPREDKTVYTAKQYAAIVQQSNAIMHHQDNAAE